MRALRPFVFLDRDGTLVNDHGYVYRIEDYGLRPGVIPGLQALRGAGYGLAIVTNQSGIGRGYFAHTDYERFQAHLLHDLERHGIDIEATYYCPHAPADGCACRKPRTGMLVRARQELSADLACSWVVGDSAVDVSLAIAAGCRSVRLLCPEPGAKNEPGPRATFEAHDFEAAVAFILSAQPR